MPTRYEIGNLNAPVEAHEHFADGLHETVSRHALRIMKQVVPRGRGELERSLRLDERFGDHETSIVSDSDHVEYVLKGTGVYGPKKRPIQSEDGGPLVFYWRKLGRWVAMQGDLEDDQEKFLFAKWAEDRGMMPIFSWPRGMRGRDFVQWTLNRLEPEIRGLAADQAAQTRRAFGS